MVNSEKHITRISAKDCSDKATTNRQLNIEKLKKNPHLKKIIIGYFCFGLLLILFLVPLFAGKSGSTPKNDSVETIDAPAKPETEITDDDVLYKEMDISGAEGTFNGLFKIKISKLYKNIQAYKGWVYNKASIEITNISNNSATYHWNLASFSSDNMIGVELPSYDFPSIECTGEADHSQYVSIEPSKTVKSAICDWMPRGGDYFLYNYSPSYEKDSFLKIEIRP